MLSADDKLAIMDVLVRYCAGIDRRDWAMFRNCFADDLVADYGPFGSWDSGDAITRDMEPAHAELGATMHRITNFVIDRSPQGAIAQSYVDAILRSVEHDGPVRQACGIYNDTLVKRDTGWKIASRKFTLVRYREMIDPPSAFQG